MAKSKYETVKEFYESGRWKKANVRDAVERGWITAEEYEEIVGEPYAG